MMGTERRRIIIKSLCVYGKAIATKPMHGKSRDEKSEIRIEKPRKSRDDGTN